MPIIKVKKPKKCFPLQCIFKILNFLKMPKHKKTYKNPYTNEIVLPQLQKNGHRFFDFFGGF